MQRPSGGIIKGRYICTGRMYISNHTRVYIQYTLWKIPYNGNPIGSYDFCNVGNRIAFHNNNWINCKTLNRAEMVKMSVKLIKRLCKQFLRALAEWTGKNRCVSPSLSHTHTHTHTHKVKWKTHDLGENNHLSGLYLYSQCEMMCSWICCSPVIFSHLNWRSWHCPELFFNTCSTLLALLCLV